MSQHPWVRITLFISAVAAGTAACSAGRPQAPKGTAGQGGAAGASGASGGAGGHASGGAGSSQAGAGGAGGAGGSAAPDGGGGSVGDGSVTEDASGGLPDRADDARGDAADAGGVVGTGCKGATVCYDFEACALPTGWTVPKGEGNQGAGMTVVDSALAHTGTCSLHMKDFSGDQAQHAYLADLPAGFGPVLWGRAWVFTTSAPTNHGALIKARYAIANRNDQDWYEVGYELKNYNGHWHNPLPPSGLPEWILRSSTPIMTGRWQCVEWLFDAGSGDRTEAADPRIWVDTQEVMFGPGLQYNGDGDNTKPERPATPRGTNFVSLEIGLTMYHPLDEKTNVYLDELALGKQRVGCGP